MGNRDRIATRAIHGRQTTDPATGALTTPIYATSTYEQAALGEAQDFVYARSQNPTRMAYERCLAELESGTEAFAFASGMAAIATVLDLLEQNSHILVVDDLYSGTYRLFETIRQRTAGLECSYVDMTDTTALKSALQPNTRLIWVESPTNPLLKLVDLQAVADFATQQGLMSVMDNTFATPVNQRPLELGFDIVLHSATKYIGGHADLVSGAVVVRGQELAQRLAYLQNAVGAIAGPFESFLAHRGLKTLPLRMRCHNENGLAVAQFLEDHAEINSVMYPGLTSHPQHKLAVSLMDGFGGMVTVKVDRDLAGTGRFLKACRLFKLAESLGGVESLIEHPAIMTHASLPKDQRLALGIDDGLIRLSVGIEAIEDLLEDLDQALEGTR